MVELFKLVAYVKSQNIGFNITKKHFGQYKPVGENIFLEMRLEHGEGERKPPPPPHNTLENFQRLKNNCVN